MFNLRNVPEGAEPEIISTIKKTFNFGQSEAVHLFQTLLECMKKKELVSRSCYRKILRKVMAFVDIILNCISVLCMIKCYSKSLLMDLANYRR